MTRMKGLEYTEKLSSSLTVQGYIFADIWETTNDDHKRHSSFH